MKKTMILLGFLALAPFAKGQLLLEVLDAPSAFTSTVILVLLPRMIAQELMIVGPMLPIPKMPLQRLPAT